VGRGGARDGGWVQRTHTGEDHRAGEGELEKAAGLEKARGGWVRRSHACGGRAAITCVWQWGKENVTVFFLETVKHLKWSGGLLGRMAA
jgi:hypothetical protein